MEQLNLEVAHVQGLQVGLLPEDCKAFQAFEWLMSC